MADLLTKKMKSSISAYEKALRKQIPSYQPNKKTRDQSKYTSPLRSKYSQVYFVEEEHKSSYFDKEVGCFLSYIMQLKDCINYMNVLTESTLEALELINTDLSKRLTEDEDKVDFETRIKTVCNLLNEALYKNTDAITKFSVITGKEVPGNIYNKYKLNLILNNGDSIDEEELDKPITIEREVLRQENIYLRNVVKKYKTKRDEYKVKTERYEADIKGISKLRKTYEVNINKLKEENNKIVSELDTHVKELFSFWLS